GHRLRSVLLARTEDLQDGYLTARNTKQNRETVHKLHADTLTALKVLPPHPSGLLFPWPFKRRQIWREFGIILKAADLPGGRRNQFHKLRRTSATHLAAAVGIEAAERHLGHVTPGLARSAYIDPRYLPTIKPTDHLPRPGGTAVST
ncbi:MAG: hypothetical protein IH899_18445, partial [Planctomycetes bacterium]|nr:hypothetical protein [Planctomycetota bacterium]